MFCVFSFLQTLIGAHTTHNKMPLTLALEFLKTNQLNRVAKKLMDSIFTALQIDRGMFPAQEAAVPQGAMLGAP